MAQILPTHHRLGIDSNEAAFQFLLSSLDRGPKYWNYFVNWEKAFANTKELEVSLNIWNYLIGKTDFDAEFRALVSRYPHIVSALPFLVVRDAESSDKFSILDSSDVASLQRFDFSKPAKSETDIDLALQFVKKSGLIRVFEDGGVKNLVDFMLGVESGLDSHGRKSRGGKAMEDVIEQSLQEICDEMGCDYLPQATPKRIEAELGSQALLGFPNRRFDFAIRIGARVIVVEVNLYASSKGGSKLKATAGEFIELERSLVAAGIDFVWVTDGPGWNTARASLHEAFTANRYVMNMELLRQGALRDVMELPQGSTVGPSAHH